jgi:hypothetical protein
VQGARPGAEPVNSLNQKRRSRRPGFPCRLLSFGEVDTAWADTFVTIEAVDDHNVGTFSVRHGQTNPVGGSGDEAVPY